jgi:hypothetical protein
MSSPWSRGHWNLIFWDLILVNFIRERHSFRGVRFVCIYGCPSLPSNKILHQHIKLSLRAIVFLKGVFLKALFHLYMTLCLILLLRRVSGIEILSVSVSSIESELVCVLLRLPSVQCRVIQGVLLLWNSVNSRYQTKLLFDRVTHECLLR